MPDSGAVYQPTTVGYTYDSGGDGAVGGSSLRSGFWRVISRHKLSSRKWFEWVLLSVALSFFIAGLTMMLVSFVSDDTSQENKIEIIRKVNENPTTSATSVEEHIEDAAKSSIALGASMMLVGLLLGFGWAWLRFFHRGKSPRGGMVGSSGQYGPVLTELPSQLKLKQTSSHDTPAIPLSDQEEETRTLMQDSTIPSVVSTGPNTIANQIPG
ncbi:uncharacterized protein LOC117159156 isoform X2 [Bombus vancouverensis nearcticus]|uniref:Uncharacterized protein LOC117211250 isoform X2 n=1 Tax=Bombus bifarius TaxID=103933 RepID=A0A6P8N8B4_9HYME|nr:uncharacterized protein LOC117159156 isoform X2 [Bombus vancouverensis nearcticus]XP_033310825.1 uncharacterized protein LOC117211250 isoform X2 [Bombus bifarius]